MVDKTKFQKLNSKFESSTGSSIPDEVVNKVGDFLLIEYVSKGKTFSVGTVRDYIQKNNLVKLTVAAAAKDETEQKKSYWVMARKILNRLGVQKAKKQNKKIEVQNGRIVN